jgi:hypothetical protein
VCGLQVSPAEFVALDEEDVGDPHIAREPPRQPVEDDVPITRGLSLLNSTPPLRGGCQTRCYKTRAENEQMHLMACRRGALTGQFTTWLPHAAKTMQKATGSSSRCLGAGKEWKGVLSTSGGSNGLRMRQRGVLLIYAKGSEFGID